MIISKPVHKQEEKKSRKKNPNSTISPNFIWSLITGYPKPPGTSVQISTTVPSFFHFNFHVI